MRKTLIIFILVFCFGCNKDDYKKVDAKALAEKELKTIDLSQVDQYPLFEECDETTSKSIQKQCFQQNLHRWLKPFLDTLSVKQLQSDTITLFLSVNEKGKMMQDSMKAQTEAGQKVIPIFKSSPKLYPALKQGVPVKVSFQLPLIITPKAIN